MESRLGAQRSLGCSLTGCSRERSRRTFGDGCVLASYAITSGDALLTPASRERLVDYRGELAPFGDSPDGGFQLYRQ